MDKQESEVERFYHKKTEEVTGRLDGLKQRKSAFAWLRLGSIAAIALVFYLLWQAGIAYVFLATVILLIVFVRLVYADLSNQEAIGFQRKLLSHYENEIKSIQGQQVFYDGSKFINKEHPYSSDLDIFGSGSLFQYINRTQTEPGSSVLAQYLTKRQTNDVILQRQEALKELSKDNDWMKRFQTSNSLNPFTIQSQERIAGWFEQRHPFSNLLLINLVRTIIPALIVTVTILFIFGKVGETMFYSALLLGAILFWQFNKIVTPLHNQLSDINQQLKALARSLELIEEKNFESPILKQLQSQISGGSIKSSAAIKKLGKQMDRLDLRYNIILSFPLNLLFLWDLQQIMSLEKWKVLHKSSFRAWIDTVAEFEALNSLATFFFNNPSYTFPEIKDDYFSIEGKNIGHPLIAEAKRVVNYIDIPATGKIMLVTGSNMAGKSTYLRSIGVNCVLAFCGAPVCATEFKTSNVSLITSMRIEDNLQESTSTFYAELKKLKVIIDKVNAGERVFILLDEILRGTNSTDRHTGSKALIKQLIAKQAVAIIATHDLELAAMKNNYPENIDNYHFDVQVNNEELYFDYRLKEGICKSMNASILMKKIGIELD
ncbi:MAG: hypothetical protein J5I50_01785 [Chitinophagaceae bacterium]|nr:hypothetical protein [Chitinophagaceae bacterium]